MKLIKADGGMVLEATGEVRTIHSKKYLTGWEVHQCECDLSSKDFVELIALYFALQKTMKETGLSTHSEKRALAQFEKRDRATRQGKASRDIYVG